MQHAGGGALPLLQHQVGPETTVEVEDMPRRPQLVNEMIDRLSRLGRAPRRLAGDLEQVPSGSLGGRRGP